MHATQTSAVGQVDPHALATSLCRRIAVGLVVSFLPAALFAGLLVAALRIETVSTQSVVLGCVLAVFYTALPVWLTLVLVRRETGEARGVPVEPSSLPELARLVREVADRLGVDPPRQVLLTFNGDLDVDISRAEPVLHLPAPLLWHCRTPELRRLLGPAVAKVALMGDARVHWSLRIGRRIRERLADDQAVPLGTWVLRWVHSRLGDDLYLLDEACDDQAFAAAAPAGLVPSSADVTEAGVALEAWDLFTERWVSPAWGRQVSPARLMAGYLAYVAALEEGGLVQRTVERGPGPHCLPDEVEAVDRLVSRGVAGWFVDLPLPDLEWTAYAERVTAPLQRQQAGALVAACSAATGRVVPASVAAVVELLENDWQDTIASLLGNPSVGQDAWKFAAGDDPVDDPVEDPRRTALPEHVRSLVVSSLVEQGAAVRQHDWLMGSLLRSPEGTLLHIDREIARLVEHGDGGALRTVLAVAGLRADAPAWLGADDAALHAWPELVIPAVRPGRARYVVVGPTDLRVVRDRSLAWGPAGRPAARVRIILETPLDGLDEAFEVIATIPFADVATARLVSRSSGAGWRCRFVTKDGVVSTGGSGSGSAMARMLRSRLGDRVTVVGNVDNDLADPGATYGLVRWMALVPGLLLLLGAGLGTAVYALATEHTAVVGSCTLQRDDDGRPQSYACTGPVVVDGRSETATLTVLRPVDPGTVFVVRAARLPVTGTVVMEPGKTRSVLTFFGALGGLLVAVAWGFGVRRWLRRRALSGPGDAPVDEAGG